METRYCKACDIEYDISKFRVSHIVKNNKNGTTREFTEYACKKCIKNYNEKNKEKRVCNEMYGKIYREKNREKINKNAREKWNENITEHANKRYERSKDLDNF